MDGNQQTLNTNDEASIEDIQELCDNLCQVVENTLHQALGEDTSLTIIINNKEFTFFQTSEKDLGKLAEFLYQFKSHGTLH